MNELMNGFFSCWMIEWFNEWFNEWFKKWFNESIFQLLSEIICSRCIIDALLFGLWNSEINCYLQVDALGLRNWEWCEGERGHKSFHLHVVGRAQQRILIYSWNNEYFNDVFILSINEVASILIINEITLLWSQYQLGFNPSNPSHVQVLISSTLGFDS